MAEFSGSIRLTNGDENKYSLILKCYEESYSIENNTSRVYWWVGIRSNTQYHAFNSVPQHFKVVVNGTTVHDKDHTLSCGAGKTVGVADGHATITHNADGSKSISASASFSCSNTQYYSPRSGSCSGTVNLTTIPRATTPSINKPSLDCGSAITISGTSASSNFSHKVYVTWNGTTTYLGTIASGTTSPSFSYTIPTDWEKNLPNSTSGIATFTLETFSGSTSVGSKSVNATIKVRSGVVPSIGTISISDTNSICAGIGQIVQSQSALKFAISASGSQGSSISSISTRFNSADYIGSSFTTSTIYASGTINYTTTVTDSRGRTASKSGSVTVVPYSRPSMTNISAKRANSSYAIDEASGTYALLHFKVGFTSLSGKNVTSFYIQYRVSGTSTWTKINSWDNNYTLEQDYKAGNLFTSTTATYEVAFGVKDKFMSDYSWNIVTVTPTYTLINFGKDGRSLTFFGQDSNQKDTLTILGNFVAPNFLSKIFPIGAVYITYGNTNPGTFLGGTWERFGQGRTLIGEGTGNDGSTSMSFTASSNGGEYVHSLEIAEMPKHNHTEALYFMGNGSTREIGSFTDKNEGGYKIPNLTWGRSSTVPQPTGYVGSGKPHNNIQPYITVYFWKRIS